jgi:hypothetical protein
MKTPHQIYGFAARHMDTAVVIQRVKPSSSVAVAVGDGRRSQTAAPLGPVDEIASFFESMPSHDRDRWVVTLPGRTSSGLR